MGKKAARVRDWLHVDYSTSASVGPISTSRYTFTRRTSLFLFFLSSNLRLPANSPSPVSPGVREPLVPVRQTADSGFLRSRVGAKARSSAMRLSRAASALKCTCQHVRPTARTYATLPPAPALDKLISAARKLIELSNTSTDNAIEASKRKKELEELRSALLDVEQGSEVRIRLPTPSARRPDPRLFFAARVYAH